PGPLSRRDPPLARLPAAVAVAGDGDGGAPRDGGHGDAGQGRSPGGGAVRAAGGLSHGQGRGGGMRILFALIGNALALLATTIVPGIVFKGDLLTLVVAGAILGL